MCQCHHPLLTTILTALNLSTSGSLSVNWLFHIRWQCFTLPEIGSSVPFLHSYTCINMQYLFISCTTFSLCVMDSRSHHLAAIISLFYYSPVLPLYPCIYMYIYAPPTALSINLLAMDLQASHNTNHYKRAARHFGVCVFWIMVFMREYIVVGFWVIY